MTARRPNLGVDWHMPDGKGGFRARRFATTTRATSDLIVLLAEQGHTVQSAHDEIRFDPEGKTVLAAMAEAGFGDRALADFVRVREVSGPSRTP